MISSRISFLLVILALLIACNTSYTRKNVNLPATSRQAPVIALDDSIPVGPHVIRGRLENGLTYYIRQNKRPENRAELRLVVNAGSILESEDQLGLAHFCEHMAFNGTKHFQKNELVNYLESIGMRFGPEINAYTSFDETVYMLLVPTDSAETLRQGIQVLEDWAHNVTYDSLEIDKERGVIIEEWRLGRGANMRMLNKQLPVILHNSRYAGRLPIGKEEILESFAHNTLRSFYKDWYRPDLMAVIVVGDVDVAGIEQLIREHFAGLTNPAEERERTLFPVPDHEQTLYAIASDPEATNSSVTVYYKMPAERETLVRDYRRSIVERLYNAMLNQRLQELTKQENPPFLMASSGKGQLVRTSDVYSLSALVKDNGIPAGLKALLTEAKRVQLHGFTASELEREKKSVLRSMEKAYSERDKNESRAYASEYIRNFLNGEPIPGIEYEYELYKTYVPGITLDEVNQLAVKWIRDQNRVFRVSCPQKDGVSVPTQADLEAVLSDVDQSTPRPYQDDVLLQPLVEELPRPGSIVKTRHIEEIGVTEWTLQNGIRVVLKATDFKNDEVRLSAFSPGGYSLVPDDLLIPAKTASGIVNQSGFGKFSQIQLQKLLADKVVRVTPYIGELTEGLQGVASPRDLETMFQLIYLSFTQPRADSTAFLSFKSRMMAFYKNRGASPEAVYGDSVTAIFTNHHPRYKPIDSKQLSLMDIQKSFKVYLERFADAGDFTFLLVGNFDENDLRPLVEQYLGALPDLDGTESWSSETYDYPRGVIDRVVHKGLEPKSSNTIIFSGPFKWSYENRSVVQTLTDVLRIKLRERLREDLGGTYGVRVRSSFAHFPRQRYQIRISFGCNPERVEELTSEVFTQIDSLIQFGTTETYLNKVKETALREYETAMKENRYWLSQLEARYFHGVDPGDILQIDDRARARTLDEIQQAAARYLRKDNYVRVVLLPEEQQ